MDTNRQLSNLVVSTRAQLERSERDYWALTERQVMDAEARHEAPGTAAPGEPAPRHEAPEPASVPAATPADEPAAAPDTAPVAAPAPAPLPEPSTGRKLSDREVAIDMFLDDHLMPGGQNEYVTSRQLLEAFDEWRHVIGAPPARGPEMGARLLARGLPRRQARFAEAKVFGGSRPTLYFGVTLKGAEPPAPLPAAVRVKILADKPGKELPAEIRDLALEVLTLHPGWQYRRTNAGRRGKPRLIAPDGKRIILPNTPSDHRAVLNTRAQLRRAGATI
jgi:hypothetical protein